MQTSTANQSASEFWRSLPLMLCALLLVVVAVESVLAAQPVLVADLSARLREALSLRAALMPSTQVLAAVLAVAAVVITSAVLLWFARAVQQAPALSLAPAWVAMCLLSVVRVAAPLPPPLTTPTFLALSAALLVGGGVAMRSRTSAGIVLGWLAVALPISVLGSSCIEASSFGSGALWLTGALVASAVGVVSIARLPAGEPAGIPGLEGVDVVQELFAQVERAEQSEARVQELERLLSGEARTKRARTLTR